MATELLSVQCYGLLTQPVFWVVFVTVFVSHMIYCFVFKKMLFSKKNENQAVLRLYPTMVLM